MSDESKDNGPVWEHECDVENAPKFLDWVRNRGGVAVWRSVNFTNASASWSTPFLEADGTPKTKPTWQAEDKPSKVHKDPTKIGVFTATLVETIPAKLVRRGMSFVLSKATEKRLDAALKRADKQHGKGSSFYRKGGLIDPELYIYISGPVISLQEWAETQDPLEEEVA